MSKYTFTAVRRKFAFQTKVEPIKKVSVLADYRGKKFPVLVSPGQIINLKKAYKKYEKENSKKSS